MIIYMLRNHRLRVEKPLIKLKDLEKNPVLINHIINHYNDKISHYAIAM